MAKSIGMQYRLRMSTPAENSSDVAAAAEQALMELFELDIKPEAVKLSPVETGTNRRSIDVDGVRDERGFIARIFSQSGYGGYLEIGTHKMKARPYMYPAVMKYFKKIAELFGVKYTAALKKRAARGLKQL